MVRIFPVDSAGQWPYVHVISKGNQVRLRENRQMTNLPAKRAYLTNGGKAGWFLTIVEAGQEYGAGQRVTVSGRREARRVCAELGAVTWNF
jgi:hypothetical protein